MNGNALPGRTGKPTARFPGDCSCLPWQPDAKYIAAGAWHRDWSCRNARLSALAPDTNIASIVPAAGQRGTDANNGSGSGIQVTDGHSETSRAGTSRPRRGGLGRGLDSLIPTAAPSAPDNRGGEAQREVDIDDIVPNPFQPRTRMDRQQLEELASSIRTHGLMQPLVVASNRAGSGWTLIAGERRWRASRLAGLSRVPVVIMDVAPQAMLELAIVENIAREDLGPLEEAMAFRQLIDEFGLSQQQVADRVGRSRASIANTVRLLGAPNQVRDALMAEQITEGHARAILGLPHTADQLTVLSMVIDKGLNVRQTEALVRTWSGKDRLAGAASPLRDPDEARIEDKLRSALGTRVALRRGARGQGGSLTIQFFSDEQLQGIYDRLVGEELW